MASTETLVRGHAATRPDLTMADVADLVVQAHDVIGVRTSDADDRYVIRALVNRYVPHRRAS